MATYNAIRNYSEVEFSELVKETVRDCLAISEMSERMESLSETTCKKWLTVYPLTTNFKTGKADVLSFVSKIYGNFGMENLLVPKKDNPKDHISFTTIIKEGKAKHSLEIVRAANAMKNLQRWLETHVDSLFFEEKQLIDKDGVPVMDEKTGKPVLTSVPVFQKIVNEDEKAINALTAMFKKIMESNLISTEYKEMLNPIFTAISDDLRPELETAVKEKEKAIENLKQVRKA